MQDLGMNCNGTPLTLDDLDAGIRLVVTTLREWGFDTIDSGDGVSKFDENGEELPGWEGGTSGPGVAHVIIAPGDEGLVACADRLLSRLRDAGVDVQQVGPDESGVEIQASYDPVTGTAIVALMGLDDRALRSAT